MDALIRRRQAILSGLAPLLGKEQTTAALEIFDSCFAEGTGFNLQSFVDQLYTQFKPDCARRELHRALVQSVFLSGGQESARVDEGFGEASHANTVFVHMLSGFLVGVAGYDTKAEVAVRSYLTEKINSLGMPVATQRALVQWLEQSRFDIVVPISHEGMRHLLNMAYVLVCEYLGPVVADRLLSEAVKKTEGLPEARVVAPRSLL